MQAVRASGFRSCSSTASGPWQGWQQPGALIRRTSLPQIDTKQTSEHVHDQDPGPSHVHSAKLPNGTQEECAGIDELSSARQQASAAWAGSSRNDDDMAIDGHGLTVRQLQEDLRHARMDIQVWPSSSRFRNRDIGHGTKASQLDATFKRYLSL